MGEVAEVILIGPGDIVYGHNSAIDVFRPFLDSHLEDLILVLLVMALLEGRGIRLFVVLHAQLMTGLGQEV